MITTENISREKKATATGNPGVDELVLQRIRLRARRRIAWLQKIWTETADDANAARDLFPSEFDTCLWSTDHLSAENAWYEEEAALFPLNKELARVEQLLLLDQSSPLARLSRTFDLQPEEKEVLQACLALILDPNLGRVYAYLQDHSGRGYVTAPLVARLFGNGLFLPLHTSSPLLAWGLVQEVPTGRGEPARLELDPFVRNWLLGVPALDEDLAGRVRMQEVQRPLSNWPVAETLRFIAQNLKESRQQPIRIWISGPEGSGRRSFAAVLARQLDLVLLAVSTDRLPDAAWSQVYRYAQRQAYLDQCALLWHGNTVFEQAWPLQVSSLQLQFVVGEPDQILKPQAGFLDHHIVLPPVPVEEGLRLWRQLIPASAGWPEEEVTQLLQREQITLGQIKAAAKKGLTSLAQVRELIRTDSRQQLGQLARQMNSAFTWNDLVVPDWLKLALFDFTYEATERHQLWKEPEVLRLFPQGRGLLALFTGNPGTGKTMAAQVIANSLQLDLFQVDLSAIVSKYVGETSKNIERILSRAASMDVVLLFDEADALFGKRTEIKDAHDRFANTDTNYLLQAIEQYPGIVILASNRKANIDGGFLRRLRYVLEFPKPDAARRRQLWQNILISLAGEATAGELEQEITPLADRLEITGAQIKFCILSALYMARHDGVTLALPHLLRGLERELMKEGRGLGQMQEQMRNGSLNGRKV